MEINETYGDWRRILGEHRWGEFLKKPTEGEKNLKSQIFFCRWSHSRELQKTGWKRIDVQDAWFREWKLINGCVIRFILRCNHHD